jgi:hypothetical protein
MMQAANGSRYANPRLRGWLTYDECQECTERAPVTFALRFCEAERKDDEHQ